MGGASGHSEHQDSHLSLLPPQATRGPTVRWTSMSVNPTPATMAPARMGWPPSPAYAGPATLAITARPISTSATASPAAMGAHARTVTTVTCAFASQGPQVWGCPGSASWGRGWWPVHGWPQELTPHCPHQVPTVRSTWMTVPAVLAPQAPAWTRLMVMNVPARQATQVGTNWALPG